MPVPPPVHYVRSGELNIAYQTVGTGPPDVVWCIGTYSHLDLLWEWPSPFAEVFERVAQFSRLLLFDKRGMGLSDRPERLQTLEERIDDIRAVLDAVSSERAFIIGQSEGGSMAMLFGATHPDRTMGLILHGAYPRRARALDWPYRETVDEFEERWRELAARNYEGDLYPAPSVARRFFGPALADEPSFLAWWRRLIRATGSPTTFYRHLQMTMQIDIRELLPSIHVPTLFLVCEDDPVVPLESARWTASRIPDAQLVVLPGQGHLIGPDILEEWVGAVEEFITGSRRPVSSRRFLTTLVACDVVGSTELIARVGDARWRDLLARHYELVGRSLAMYGGVEVDRAGEGLLARFDGPARAIRFAREIDREDQTIGLRSRGAVHTGEVEVSNGAVRGMAVHITWRLIAIAQSGEVVVSGTVKDLVAGAGFSFMDRGAHTLKGVPEPKQVFALTT